MADSADRIGSVFAGRYTLERELGAGGMATVYLTTDHKHNRKVAVKVLRPEFAAAVGRDRFLREIEIVGHLTHPHILPLYDSGVLDELCYFVMPYVTDASSLRTRLDREGPLPIEEAIQVTREIADGLAYAHAHHVVHRDIKPQNIMLEAGHAVIADFGIALALDGVGADRLTDTGFSLGTPHYMSPEQASAARRLDGRTDVYSLGCVLYEMLAGHPPFTGPSLHAIMARHTVEPPPSLRIVRETVSESLERVCFRMLAKSPADRFQSAEELIVALTEVSYERVRETAPTRTTGGVPTTIPSGRRTDPVRAGHTPASMLDTAASQTSLPLLVRIVLGVVATSALLILVGFLTVTVYDEQLELPAQFTPSQSDFLVVGARALFPSSVYALITVAIAIACLQLARLLLGGALRIPSLRRRVGPIRQRVEYWRTEFTEKARPGNVADLFLIFAVLVAGAAIAASVPLLTAVFTSDVSVLGCARRGDHRFYQPAMTAVIVGLAFGRFRLLRWVRWRTGDLAAAAVTRWATGALVVLLIVVMTLPWRLMWPAGNERVRIGDDRGYVLQESMSHIVVYNADRERASSYEKPVGPELVRLGLGGYVFEEPHIFDSGVKNCESITRPARNRSPQ
jgi:serine/threonine protein kinase